MRSKTDRMVLKGSAAYHGTDPEALSELLTRTIFPVKVEALNNRSVSFNYEFASVGPIAFGRGSYEGDTQWRQQGGSECGKLLFLVPSIGNASICTGRAEVHSMPGWATIMEGDRIDSLRIHGSRRNVAMYIDETELVERLTRLLERPVRGCLDIHPSIELALGPGQVLRHLIEAASDGIMGNAPLWQSPLALSNLCETLKCLILETLPHRFSEELLQPATQPAPWHVKRAIDFMHAHLADPVTLEDIATAASTSGRSLQEGFKRFKLMSPMAYLQTLRLSAVHLDLLNHDIRPTVADVAFKWGFVHLGRFSAAYRAAYGENPSETLRRCAKD